jgi:uncharacterized protein YbbK (DUF523 family)
MEKILVSACLVGARVRYDGRDIYCDNGLLRKWIAEGRVVPICPEVAAGLPVPRGPHEIVGPGGGLSVLEGQACVTVKERTDHTTHFLAGAETALEIVRREKIRLAILKNNSPSCGSTLIYDGSFTGSRIRGLGVTAALLKKNGVEVFTEESIDEVGDRLRSFDGD